MITFNIIDESHNDPVTISVQKKQLATLYVYHDNAVIDALIPYCCLMPFFDYDGSVRRAPIETISFAIKLSK